MDPEDLLQQERPETESLQNIDAISQHLEENALALELLANHSLSFR